MNQETQQAGEGRRFSLPTGNREFVFLVLSALCGLGMCNSLLFGGANLAFAVFAVLSVVFTVLYLLLSGVKPTFYSILILALCVAMAAGFARSNDNPVKLVLATFLFFGINLGLCLMTRHNRFHPGTFRTLLDAPVGLILMGFGRLPHAIAGLFTAGRKGGGFWRKGGAFLLGLCVALPLVAVVMSLLDSADAAFSGMLDKLPSLNFGELFVTVLLGVGFVLIFYTRGVSLAHTPTREAKQPKPRGFLSPITVNTVLGAIAAVYVLYLVSQLAYFVGGFAGFLPKGFTMAQYARRGFFEMAGLCAINLTLTVLATFLVRKKLRINLLTRLICLFIGLVTLFLVCSASAKMFLYIDSFGLTRMRVLTQIIMLFLAIVDLVAMVWLFAPKLPYMRFVVIAALLIGTATVWLDVDTLVAGYNTQAYLSGKLDTVDVAYLRELNHAAVPSLSKLAQEAPDAKVAEEAQSFLDHWTVHIEDYRSWNYASATAEKLVPAPVGDTETREV